MKIIKSTVGMVLLVLLVLSCQSQVDLEKEKAELMQTDRDFSDVSKEKGAAEAFHEFLTEDAIQLPTRANPVIGREAIFKSMSSSTANYIMTWEPQNGEVANSGDFGYTWGIYTINWPDKDDESKINYGKYLNVWKKQDGNWKVIIDMGN